MLDGRDAARGEAAAVADALYVVDDRDRWIAAEEEIAVQRMHETLGVDGLLRRRQRLSDYLAAENALQAGCRTLSPKQVEFQFFKVKYSQKPLYGERHTNYLRGITAYQRSSS